METLRFRQASSDEAAEFFEQGGCAFAFGHRDADHLGDLDRQAGVGGEHEDGDVGFDEAHVIGDLASGHAGHTVVEDDGFYGLGGEEVDAGGSVECGEDAVSGSLEEHLADLQAYGFVVNAEDEVRGGAWGGGLRQVRRVRHWGGRPPEQLD